MNSFDKLFNLLNTCVKVGILLPAFFLPHRIAAQASNSNHFLEAGIAAGALNYSGDLVEPVLRPGATRAGFSVSACYHFMKFWSLRAALTMGNIGGSDAHARDPELRRRNLSFVSNVMELSLRCEWNFMQIEESRWEDQAGFKVVPALFVGIGGVQAHPNVQYHGTPETMAMNVPYHLPETGLTAKMWSIPFGCMAQTGIASGIRIGVEASAHPVVSDLLDGVSKNGNPRKKDWFYTLMLTAAVRLTGN